MTRAEPPTASATTGGLIGVVVVGDSYRSCAAGKLAFHARVFSRKDATKDVWGQVEGRATHASDMVVRARSTPAGVSLAGSPLRPSHQPFPYSALNAQLPPY